MMIWEKIDYCLYKNVKLKKIYLLLINKQKTEQEWDNFIAGNIKTRRSDILNPYYFNGTEKEIIKLNNDMMNYNLKEALNKFTLK